MMAVTTPARTPIVLRNCFVCPYDVDGEPRIGGERALEFVEALGAVEPDAHRARAAAPESGSRNIDIGPQLAFVRVTGLEYADHGPIRATHAHDVADVGALELAQDAAADDQLAHAGREVAAGDDLQLRTECERSRVDTANGNVRAALDIVFADELGDHQQLGRSHRCTVGTGTNAAAVLDEVAGIAIESGIDLGIRAAPHDHRDVRPAGGFECIFEARRHREQRGEHRDHAGQSDDDYERGGPALGNALDVDARDGADLPEHGC